jgi:hypothetical protein
MGRGPGIMERMVGLIPIGTFWDRNQKQNDGFSGNLGNGGVFID